MLQLGVGAPRDTIFCTSLEGHGIPKGKNFKEFIKSEIQNPALVIQLLTPHYYESLFCMCELGASWALSSESFPILVPPLSYDDLKAVLDGVQAATIDSKNDLNDLRDTVSKVLDIQNASTANWEVRRDKFLSSVEKLIKKQDPPKKVAYGKFAELKNDYDGSKDELRRSFEEQDKLRQQIEDLLKCKDASETQAVVEHYSDEWDVFHARCEKVKQNFKKLPRVAIEALYYDHREVSFFANDEEYRDIKNAVEHDFVTLREDDNEIRVNLDDPTMADGKRLLAELGNFLEKATPEFCDQFEKRHNYQPSLSNRRFWDGHLRSAI